MLKFLKKKANKSVKLKYIQHIQSSYTEIDKKNFRLGQCRMNGMCHINAVQDALTQYDNCNSNEIVLMFCIKNGDPIIHFVNKRKILCEDKWDFKDGFQDNTFGWTYKNQAYYFDKIIYQKDFNKIDSIFRQRRKELAESIGMNWFERKFSTWRC